MIPIASSIKFVFFSTLSLYPLLSVSEKLVKTAVIPVENPGGLGLALDCHRRGADHKKSCLNVAETLLFAALERGSLFTS